MIFGSGNIRIFWNYENNLIDKTVENYSYKYKYAEVLKKVRKDARNGNKKTVLKGNYKEFQITLYDITKEDLNNYYSKLANPDDGFINIMPHKDLDFSYKCYLKKIDFELMNKMLFLGKVKILFVASEYAETSIPCWILETGIWQDNCIWMDSKLWKDEV